MHTFSNVQGRPDRPLSQREIDKVIRLAAPLLKDRIFLLLPDAEQTPVQIFGKRCFATLQRLRFGWAYVVHGIFPRQVVGKGTVSDAIKGLAAIEEIMSNANQPSAATCNLT
jgi:hypothetical protein